MTLSSISLQFSNLIFLVFVFGIPAYGMLKKIHVYDAFIDGAKDGIDIAIKIIPYLVAMLVAIGMLRASGFFQTMGYWFGDILNTLGIPIDILPLALIRPFSGSAANGVLLDIINEHGGDAFISKVAATMMGSTETTFYVVAIYFGAVQIKKTRYAIPAGLFADLIGVLASIWICRLIFVS